MNVFDASLEKTLWRLLILFLFFFKARKEKVEKLTAAVCAKRRNLTKPVLELQQAFNIYCEFAATDVSDYKPIGFTSLSIEIFPCNISKSASVANLRVIFY